MSELLISEKPSSGLAAYMQENFTKAKGSEQEQPVSSVQQCPNKKWIELHYKYPSDRPVAGATFIITDLNGKKIKEGKLDARGHARVPDLSDSLCDVRIFYTGDPKPFEIFENKKPIKNPYLTVPAQQAPAEEPNMFKEGAIKALKLYLAYREIEASVGRWTWGAIQGDWNDDQTLGQIVVDSAISMIPFVDQAADVRDLSSNLYKLIYLKKYDEFSPWFSTVLTVIGMFPELGSAVKGAVKCVIKVGKEAASAVLKKGVKFGEQLILKSGIDLDSLIRFMNDFGEGNVIRWLQAQVKEFDKFKNFVRVKIADIFLSIKMKCLEVKAKLLQTLGEKLDDVTRKLDEVAKSIDELMERIDDYVPQILERARQELDDLTKRIKDYFIEGKTMTENGARQIADDMPTTYMPEPKNVKNHPKARRLSPEEIKKIADAAGMEPHEVMGLINHANKNNQRIVIRFTNPDSLKWHGKPHHIPKSIDVKLKTAKSGPNAGLVVRPKEPMEDWEIQNIIELQKKGYEFHPSGCLIDNKGNKIYGDYDLQSVQAVDPKTGKSSELMTDQSATESRLKEINGSMNRTDANGIGHRDPVQHNAEDQFLVKTQEVTKMVDGKPVKTREIVYDNPATEKQTVFNPKTGKAEEIEVRKGKPVMATKEDMEAGNSMLGRQHGEDEKYLVINPDQTSEVLENPHELYEMNRKNGLPWRYEATPATGEQLAKDQAERAKKRLEKELEESANAVREKLKVESFIDDIISDSHHWEKPANYVQVGATPF